MKNLSLRRLIKKSIFAVKYSWRQYYTVNIFGKDTKFSTKDAYSIRWFFPRYGRRGVIHEKPITYLVVDICRTSTCFVDVGANLGWFTCIAASHIDGGEVHSFEIDDKAYEIAKNNIDVNALQNVKLNMIAVGDKKGHISYYRNPNNINPSSGITQSSKKFTDKVHRKMTSLDAYFKSNHAKPNLIKIDVEGAEIKVLEGMRYLMSKYKPKIIMEVHPSYLKKLGYTVYDAIAILNNYSYCVKIIHNHRGEGEKACFKNVNNYTFLENTTLYAE